jgi:hypothetical protein
MRAFERDPFSQGIKETPSPPHVYCTLLKLHQGIFKRSLNTRLSLHATTITLLKLMVVILCV